MTLKSFAVFVTVAMGTTAFGAHKYDMSKTSTLSGTVTKVEWNNKDYVKIHMDAPGKNGKTKDWEIQTASKNKLQSDGITRTTLKQGDQISVQGHPAASGSPHMLATSFTLANGQNAALNAAPQPLQQPAEVAANNPPPDNSAVNNPPADTDDQSLPRTASNLPLIGLIGLLSLGAGTGLALLRRRLA